MQESKSELVETVDTPDEKLLQKSAENGLEPIEQLAPNDDDDADDDDDEGNDVSLADSPRCFPCLKTCCHRWPRICSVFLGVVLPLWLLIFLSLFTGLLLSRAEGKEEGTVRRRVVYYVVWDG